MMRKCTICKIEKDISCFSKTQYMCKICAKEYNRQRYIKKSIDNAGLKNKICGACHLEKPITEFYKNQHKCKVCQKEYSQNNKDEIKSYKHQYFIDNKEELTKKNRERYISNRVETLEKQKDYYNENKEYIKKRVKEYSENNRESIKVYQKEYREKNKEDILEYQNSWTRDRSKHDIVFKLRRNVSRDIYTALKKVGSSKKGSSILKHIPYTIQELKDHLEKLFSHPDNLTPDGKVWMNWDNWGVYDVKTWDDADPTTWKWNIDHIIAHSTFHYTSMEDQAFKDCWALNNLRPYSAKQNILDGNRRSV